MFECCREMLSRESRERFSVQQSRPEYRFGHVSHFAPAQSSRECGADDAAHACSRHHSGSDAGFLKGLDDADVGESAYSAATKGQADAFVLNGFESGCHVPQLSH